MDVNTQELPAVLRGIAPEVGSVWEWEPLKDYAHQTVRVTAVTWNGEECWVESEQVSDPLNSRVLNELGRWTQATVMSDWEPGDT